MARRRPAAAEASPGPIGKACVGRRVAAGGEARADRKQPDAGQWEVRRSVDREPINVAMLPCLDCWRTRRHRRSHCRRGYRHVVRREIDRCRGAGHRGIDHFRLRHPGDMRKIVEQPRLPLPPAGRGYAAELEAGHGPPLLPLRPDLRQRHVGQVAVQELAQPGATIFREQQDRPQLAQPLFEVRGASWVAASASSLVAIASPVRSRAAAGK